MLQPLHDSIIVRPDPAVQLSAILVTPTEDTKTGTVVATGPGKRRPDGKREPMWVSVGDRVMFSGTIDRTVEHEGEKYLVMRNGDLIGLADG